MRGKNQEDTPKMRQGLTRRTFLKGAGGAAAFTIVPRKVLGGSGYIPPSEELTRAIIGVGGMGKGHMSYPGARLLAVCDVDRNHLDGVLEQTGDEVKGYHDFREVLERPDIDVIHVVTPPHWHGLMAVAAAKAGKDIWCEKPMTRTIGEGQAVVDAVQRYGRMFRLNTWFRFRAQFYGYGTQSAPIKKVCEHRLLGWPLKVIVGEHQGFNFKFRWVGKTGVEPEPVPPELDYDFWLGPAPYKPYHPHRVHGSFRGYWDYDGGGLGDMGQHYLDPVQYFLEKDDTSPIEIEVDAPQQHPDAVGEWRRIHMKYADGSEIILDGAGVEKDSPYIEGPEGKLYKDLESDVPGLKEKIEQLPDAPPRVTDFSEAVRTRQKFTLNEANGHRSCTLVNLSKIAMRLGRNLKFDPVKQEFIDDPGANRLIHQPMRPPWSV